MSRYLFIIIGVIPLFLILKKVKKNLFSEEKSIFWMLGGICILILSIFPKLIDKLSALLGIAHPPSLLFLLTSFFILYIIFRQDQDISLLNERVKEMGQRNAILEQKINKLTENNEYGTKNTLNEK